MAGFMDMMGSAYDTMTGWLPGGSAGSNMPTGGGGMPLSGSSFGSMPAPDTGMSWNSAALPAPDYSNFMVAPGQSMQMGGAMTMPTAVGGTGDIANSAGELGTFKSTLAPTDFFGGGPAGSIVVGDYAMTPEQFATYGDLGKRYGQGYVDQFLGVKGADAPSWFASKGVPLSKMALAGGSLYLGSKTADAFKKQMEASQAVAQKNLENQTALINTYMYDRQAARYAADPSSQQTPEEYMAEHGL